MPRYAIPSSNTSFNTHLQPAYGTYSLNTMGGRAWPRETTSGTRVSEITPNTYVYECPDLRVYNDRTNSYTTIGGDIEYIAPFTLGPTNGTLSPGKSYIVNDDTYSGITVEYTPAYGYEFVRWANGSGGAIGTSNPIIIPFTNSNSYGSTIRAEVTDQPLNPPQLFSAIDFGFTIELTWQAPVGGNQDSYDIQWFGTNWNTEVTNYNGAATSYTDTTLTGQETEYRIRANYAGVGSSNWVGALVQ